MDRTDLGIHGKSLLQFKDAFRSGEDAVALVHFAEYCQGLLHPEQAPKTILDIGCGAGMILTLLLEHYPEALGFGIEKVRRLADLAQRNMRENGLERRSKIYPKDARRFINEDWPWGRMSLIVANPPYRSGLPRGGLALATEREQVDFLNSYAVLEDNVPLERQLARFDLSLNPTDLARIGARLLDDEACFCLVYPLARETELCHAMESQRLFLNRRQRLCGWADKEPKQGLFCFTAWTGKAAVTEEDRVLRAAASEEMDSSDD